MNNIITYSNTYTSTLNTSAYTLLTTISLNQNLEISEIDLSELVSTTNNYPQNISFYILLGNFNKIGNPNNPIIMQSNIVYNYKFKENEAVLQNTEPIIIYAIANNTNSENIQIRVDITANRIKENENIIFDLPKFIKKVFK